MYMSLSNCKLNDKLYKESLRFRAIESAVDYVVEEFRRDPLHDDFTLWWGHTSIALLDDGDTIDITIRDDKNPSRSAHYTESIEDWIGLICET